MLSKRALVWMPAVLLVAACQSAAMPAAPPASPVEVDRIEMRDNAFAPPAVQVPAGTVVTWAFTDGGRRHNVVGDGFESEVLAEGTFRHPFSEPGTHAYRCTLHAGMEGHVVVTGGPDASGG